MRKDAVWEKVRALAETDRLACCLHGRAEVVAAFHRQFREQAIGEKNLTILIKEFDRELGGRSLPVEPKSQMSMFDPIARGRLRWVAMGSSMGSGQDI